MMVKILEDAGVESISRLQNTEATKEKVLDEIKRVGELCDENDVFVFFYSGHGNPMPDQDCDEEDGKDEAMCLPYSDGRCDEGSWLRDDDFADAVATHVTAGSKVIILDCCHSGTLLDFSKDFWKGQKAVSITGCRDAQESAAMGGGTRGGAFSKCLNAAVRSLGDKEDYSVAKVYNLVLSHGPTFIPSGHSQDITIQTAPGTTPADILGPIVVPKS